MKDKSKSKTVVKKNIVKEIKKTLKKKRRVKRAAVKKRSREGRGVIYLGHIPHGFYENEMKKYFSQFGLVTNIALSRSKRSGRSQGFAFIEFLSREVAKIAAESMNNYIMFSRVLKCELLPESKKVTFFEPIEKMPGVEQNRVFHNEPDEEDETVAQKKFKNRAGKVNKRIKKLKDLGLFVPIEPVKL